VLKLFVPALSINALAATSNYIFPMRLKLSVAHGNNNLFIGGYAHEMVS